MKTIIAGSRGITKLAILQEALNGCFFKHDITEVVSGTAAGVDRLGEKWANSQDIPIRRFPADWNTFGRSAGYIRNKQMAEYADAAIILWDGESKGTKHMIDLAQKMKLRTWVVLV